MWTFSMQMQMMRQTQTEGMEQKNVGHVQKCTNSTSNIAFAFLSEYLSGVFLYIQDADAQNMWCCDASSHTAARIHIVLRIH